MAASAPEIAQECVEGYVFAREPLQLLILRRPPSRGSIWVPVSGKVEAGDLGLEPALRRELVEETGFVRPLEVRPLDWHVPFDGPDGRRWRLHAYSVEMAESEVPRLSSEHDTFAWLPPPEAVQRLHYPDNQEAARRVVRRAAQAPGIGRGLEGP